MSIWFSSDWHVRHRNILRPDYADRPFSSLDEMEDAIVDNWNSKVKPGDIGFFLGDFAFQVNNERERIKEVVSRLVVKPIICKGNHDSKPKLLDMGFEYVYDEIYLTIDGIKLWLNHFPLIVHDERAELKRPKARLPYQLALCGHKHSKTLEQAASYNQWGKLVCLDVGIDSRKDYSPWSWEEIKELYGKEIL